MVRPGADWKDQPPSVFNWVIVLNVVALLMIDLYRWWQEGGVIYALFAVVLITWGILYFTNHWQPILYLVVSAIVSVITAVWILMGIWVLSIIQVIIALNLIFVILGIYLFHYEEHTLYPFKPDRS